MPATDPGALPAASISPLLDRDEAFATDSSSERLPPNGLPPSPRPVNSFSAPACVVDEAFQQLDHPADSHHRPRDGPEAQGRKKNVQPETTDTTSEPPTKD